MKILRIFSFTSIFLLIMGGLTASYAQVVGTGTTNTNGSTSTAITTAVPFLTISPDSRSGGMGEAGVALSPDVNSTFWNPSKLAFIDNPNSMSLSYSPWLRNLVPDINLSYLSYARKLDDRNAIGFSLRYFNLGTIELYDNNAIPLGTYKPDEFSLDGTFARKFGDNFSLGVTVRYIHSSLTNGTFVSGQQTRAANDVAADASLYFKNPTQQFGTDALFAFGVNISNIGPKLSYTTTGQQYFLPTNLKIGAANTWYLDEDNALTFTLDLNKLLVVPTQSLTDASGSVIYDNRSVVSSIFSSFSSANGGFSTINYATGLEYVYNKLFALRAGYFYETPEQGNRSYLTLGTGIKYSDFAFNFSYLIANQSESPLANTLRFSLGYNFGGK